MPLEQSSWPNPALPESSVSPCRSRNGCQQCRQRKRKCDEQHPRCLACIERGLPCNWQRNPSRRRQLARRSHNFNKDFTLPQEMQPLVTVFAVPSTPIQERLLSYFHTNGPLWLTSGGNVEASSGVIIPVALQSPLIMNCVLTVAAGDLGKYQPANTDMTSLACGFYGQAVAGIHSALKNELSPTLQPASYSPGKSASESGSSNHNSLNVRGAQLGDELLLAVILLCVHEAVNFSTISRIFPHLVAAVTLCNDHPFAGDTRNTELRGLFFEVLCYLLTLTSFSHGHSLPLHLITPRVFTTLFSAPDGYKGVLLGNQCREIFSLILRVSMLQRRLTSPYDLDETSAVELRDLKSQLERGFTTNVRKDEAAACDEIAISELYRLACLIYVEKMLDAERKDNSEAMQNKMALFISTLNSVPPSSPANNILTWPLFVAGMSSVVPSHRRLIIGRLKRNYESWWRSDILSKSADLLSQKWKQDDSIEDGTISRRTGTIATQWPGIGNHMADFPVALL
ncbi:unnamed protein product [Clonostachys chloroleuca]|uniref:Zn(2)-C6 fungal-type domain-containing protein n=1 Tax=Clonostachys chloroleuca TaxID=1926264 RepID=A0AA35M0J1_9HYPO|nr:unnamed protein product [Clonostachys chloroleuca]